MPSKDKKLPLVGFHARPEFQSWLRSLLETETAKCRGLTTISGLIVDALLRWARIAGAPDPPERARPVGFVRREEGPDDGPP